ncbi:hypothetical protein KVR01_007456 [Diaporthe batatas]|uniref:uncharacterized protein n=1 Tax=Diaporthe batatas TaxID=748121 RepID=UPI001D05897F|nr:uncharacterized protein KVR01_007456 [Diaporthe batatas]KAG8162978.1 hypothetical protein KVR01_007456 [Diaporthe batatas]
MARLYTNPEKLQYPKDTSLTEVLLYHNLNNTPDDKPTIIDGYTGETVFTYTSFRTGVRKIARHFSKELGIGTGDVVGILSTTKQKKEIQHALGLSKPTHILVEKALLPNLLKALSGTSGAHSRPSLYVWDAEAPAGSNAHTLNVEHILEHGSADFEPAKLAPGVAAQQVAFICFSSGTSGLVKGVQLTHENIVANLFQQSQGLRGMFNPRTVVTLIVPFFHILGLAGFCCQFISQGVPIVVFKRFEMVPLLAAIKRHRITHINVVPPIALEFLRNPEAAKGDWSSVQCLMNAAAPLKQKQSLELSRRYGCVVTQWYGMTEASPSVASQREDETNVDGTIGRPLPGMEMRILDENGDDAKVGEFVLRGPNIMKGYVGGTPSSALTPDGFLRTGDIGYVDDRGYLYIVDRAKEMIKVKGQQVAPAELEAILIAHPHVKDAAVCGVYNEDGTSEVPIAYITTDTAGSAAQETLKVELIKYVNDQVARYKRITGGVHILDAIPRNPSGKILRRLLPANLAAASAARRPVPGTVPMARL